MEKEEFVRNSSKESAQTNKREKINEGEEINWKNGEIENNGNNINSVPEIPMTEKERAIKLLEYMDIELSNKEEETFYKKENISYTARMDTDVNYNNKMYYQKFYLSKETIVEKREKGIYSPTGVYITPTELRDMGKEALISVEEMEKGVFKEYDDGTIIIHWSSPIANLYYENEKHKMQINDYTYNTMLIRNFEFNPLKFYNKYIADNEFYKNGTVDEFLIKVLLDKKNSNELTDIIFTIQENQNKIIRADSKESFIVQGCAGSGKTMILLHRLSYLKFNNKLPNYDKIKIITPNQLFSNFIKTLTKDLSIQYIEQITIDNYYFKLNNLYIEKYNKIEEIEEKFYRRHKERIKKEFCIENIFNEYEILNDKIADVYSSKMLDMINNEYVKLMSSINQELQKNNLRIENQFSSNQIYYEQVIKNITKKIDELNHRKDNIEEICVDMEHRINNLEKKLNNLNKENIKNVQTIQEINDKCDKIEKEMDIIINKRIIFKRKIFSMGRQNYKISDLAFRKNQSLKSSQSKILEENEFCMSMENKIKDLENKLNNLNQEKIKNTQIIKEINDKCNNIKKEMENKVRKKKILLGNTRNSSIIKKYYEDIKLEYKKIQKLNLRQSKILEEVEVNAKEKAELTQKLKEYKVEKEKKRKINKRKIVLENMSNSSLIRLYYESLNLEYEKINNLNLRQFNIIEKLEVNIKEKDELNQKLLENKNKKNIIQIEIDECQDLKINIIDKVYFTIDIYKEIIAKIRDEFSLSIPPNMYSKIDLLVFLYINYLHIGKLINGDKLLCIDEAQNYNVIEIEILNMINKDVIINLYGDTNQAIYTNGIYDWDNLNKSLNLKEYVLNENYRNSIEINGYCNEKFGYDILGMGLSVKPIERIEESQIIDIINEKIRQKKNIAIISKDEILDKIDSEFVSYCNIQDVKGIEYNTVIVNDRNMNKNEKYIAYTRALSELYILNS